SPAPRARPGPWLLRGPRLSPRPPPAADARWRRPPPSPRARAGATPAPSRARCAARSRAPTWSRPSIPRLSSRSLRDAGGGPEPRHAAGAAEQLGDQRQLGPVGAPGQGRAHRLEQLPALQAERLAERLNRGFNLFAVPLRKAVGRGGECLAQFGG